MADSGFSGKFVLRISPALHRALAQRAEKNSLSLNQTCASLLGSALDEEKQGEVFCEKLKQAFGPALLAVVLFGSRARGSAMDTSDTDLLLVFSPDTEISRALYRKWEDSPDSEAFPNLSLHCVALPDLERVGSLWLEVALDGIVLWENGTLVSKSLRTLKRQIVEGHYIREKSHGHGYWRKIS